MGEAIGGGPVMAPSLDRVSTETVDKDDVKILSGL